MSCSHKVSREIMVCIPVKSRIAGLLLLCWSFCLGQVSLDSSYQSLSAGIKSQPAATMISANPDTINWKKYLSISEQDWIRNHPDIRLGIDPEFYPFEFRGDNGEYQGIASDYIKMLNTRFGLNLRVVNGITWTQAVAGAKEGSIDVLPCVGFSEARAQFLLYSKPYIRFQRVILTRIDMPFISSLDDIKSLRVGVQVSSSHEGFLRDRSGIKPVLFPSLEECLLALSSGKIDAAVANVASATYWIRKLNLINIKVAAPVSSEPDALHFAVRKDWPELVTIINKGLELVSPEEKRSIEQRWVSIEYKPGIEPRVAWRIGLRIAAVVLLVLAIILVWLYRLKQEIKRRKKTEETLARYASDLNAAKDRAESADRLKSAFLATMSHELRTPLNSIIGFTGILLQGIAGPLNEEQTKQLRMVKNSGQHLLDLINDVLDISRIEADQFDVIYASFDLYESINKVIQSVTPLAEKKNLPLRVQIAPEVHEITSDRRRVEQIMLNLLSNAIKFTEKGEVNLTAEAVSGMVRISVSDTGQGIRSEDLGILFQPFRQVDSGLARQYEGTGLGLAICKKLVEKLGGTITVESEFGSGSTFRFTIPLQASGACL